MTAPHIPDFLAIGHVTIDLLADGTPVLGGSALYAGLTAARFGLHAAILTRGNFTKHGDAIAQSLSRFAGEVEIIAQSSSEPTVFINETVAGRRRQTIRSWAGQIDINGLPAHWRSAPIVHLAPVAQEIEPRQVGRLSPAYFGATPQGWMRDWTTLAGGVVRLGPLRLPFDVLGRLDAVVVSSQEQALARDSLESIGARGLVAVTRGAAGAQILDRGRVIEVPAYPVRAVDDTGAGDVFAASLFVLRANHESTPTAARLASAAAALRIQGMGPDAVPSRERVEEFALRMEQSTRSHPRPRPRAR